MKKLFIALASLLFASVAHAQTLMPNLGAAAAASDTDLVAVYQGANPLKKMTAAQVATYIFGKVSGAATATSGGVLTLSPATALSLKGNPTNASASPTDISTTSGSNFPLRENGAGVLSFGPLNGGFALNNNTVPLNKLANGTANTIMGALSAAAHTDIAVPSCSATGNALNWTAGTGPGCVTGLTSTIASGTAALGTGAIASGACAAAVTATATGTATTDVVSASFNGDPTAVTGYIPSTAGMLAIISYPTANTVNFKVCNNTASSITPGVITLNWRVTR